MPDDSAPPFESLSRWLGDDAHDEPGLPSATPTDRARHRRPPRRVIRAAALLLPWLIILAVLGARAADMATDTTTSPGGGPSPASAARSPGHLAEAGDPPAPADQMGALAVRLVRDALTGRRADGTTAVDVATPESPRALGSDQWLVRVHVVVLRGDARRWRSATHEVWAVPVGLRPAGAVGLERPWRVATDHPRVRSGRWSAASVDEAAVRVALRGAGLRAAEALDAERHPAIAGIVRVRAADGGRTTRIWVRTTPTAQVLGTSPAGAGDARESRGGPAHRASP